MTSFEVLWVVVITFSINSSQVKCTKIQNLKDLSEEISNT